MGLKIFNQQRRFLRVFLFLGLGSGSLALVSAAIALSHRGTPNGVPTVTAFLLAVFAVTMLISAAATLPSARRADRLITRMQGGEALAHWVYSPSFWQAWVLAEQRGFSKLIWAGSAVVAVLGAIIVAALISTPATTGPIPWGVVVVVATITLGTNFLSIGGIFAYRRRRTRRLLACGECWLMKDAVYVGGDFIYWNADMRGLYAATLIPATATAPACIALSIGLTRKVAGIARAASLSSLAGGGLYFGDYQATTRIPVEAGQMTEAQRIVTQWAAAQ